MLHAAALLLSLPQIQLGSQRHVRTVVFPSRNQELPPLFLVGVNPGFHSRQVLGPRCWPASASSSSRIRCCAGERRPLHRSKSSAASRPPTRPHRRLATSATARYEAGPFAFLQNAGCHDKRHLLCWRSLPRGFPPPHTAPGLTAPTSGTWSLAGPRTNWRGSSLHGKWSVSEPWPSWRESGATRRQLSNHHKATHRYLRPYSGTDHRIAQVAAKSFNYTCSWEPGRMGTNQNRNCIGRQRSWPPRTASTGMPTGPAMGGAV
jgi:hypothetical protein